MAVYQAIAPFAFQDKDGNTYHIGDQILTADHIAVRTWRGNFVELDSEDATDGIVETTRKNPGEKRATKRPA
jgi:hypothetical protein